MAKGKRMCPTPSCPEVGKSTSLLGGCAECGAALVPFKSLDDEVRERLWELTSPEIKRAIVLASLSRK